MKLILTALLIILNGIALSQDTYDQNLLSGSEKPIRKQCNKYCLLSYKNYDISIKKDPEEIGEEIRLIHKKTGKTNISTFADGCTFLGLFENYLILDCGTDVIRGIRIFDIANKRFLEIEEGVLPKGMKILNNRLYCLGQMSVEKIKKHKLKEGNCETQICGYYEEMFFDFTSRKKIYTGKFHWEK